MEKVIWSTKLLGYLLLSVFILSLLLSIFAFVQPVNAYNPTPDAECDETCTLKWIETICGDCAWLYPDHPDWRTFAYWCCDDCWGNCYWEYRYECGIMCPP